MAIKMTRAEYEQEYGNTPVIPKVSELDSEPTFSTAPIQMTREEYNAKYNIQQEPSADVKSAMTFKPWFAARDDDGIVETGLKAAGNVIPSALNLGLGLVQVATSPIDTAKSIFSITKGSGAKIGREVLERTGFEEQVSQVPESESEQAFNQMFDFFKDNYYGTENLQRTVTNDPFGAGIDILGLLVGGATAVGKLDEVSDIAKATKTKVVAPAQEVIEKAKGVIKKPDAVITKRADQILDIESNYSQLRKMNDRSPDADASRTRIASTDVLSGAVNEDGLIRTTDKGGAVDRYRKATLDGYENVVKQNLEREGATINLNEVRSALLDNVYSGGFEGADLIAAQKKVNREIAGLAERADEFGNVPLEKLHDAKIATTKNINYNNPLSQNYRKAVANTYKTLVENKSKTNVKAVNAELAKYYQDIERLRNLDGKRVKGGKLGKYFAQTTGNIAGGIAGSFGGPLGTVAGTVVGGEVSTALKGKTLAKTFGKELGLKGEKNAILEAAKQTGTLPMKRNLKLADPKVGATKNIPKTEEVIRLEKLIEKNIKDQKVAIKAKDFTLVNTLKDVYNSLVEKLVDTIKSVKKRIDETPNKEGGFIKVGSDDLLQEAKKYKSADEFVEGKDIVLYHGGSEIKDIKLGKSNFQNTFYMSDNPVYAKSYGGNKSKLNEIVLSGEANLADMSKPNKTLIKQIEKIISPKDSGQVVSIKRPDGTVLKVPKTTGGLENAVYSTKQIIKGLEDGKAMFAELPEVKNALKKLGYDGQITQESKYGLNYGVWNKGVVKVKN